MNDHWLLVLNLIGCTTALSATIYALLCGDRFLRTRFMLQAILAVGYLVAIVAQLADEIWGLRLGRYLGPIAWFTIWAWPPVQTTRRFRAIRQEVTRTFQEMRERLR